MPFYNLESTWLTRSKACKSIVQTFCTPFWKSRAIQVEHIIHEQYYVHTNASEIYYSEHI